MDSPMSVFFKLGDKVTGGDPKRMADWNYYMLWIIFLAFFAIFTGNIWEFIHSQKLANLGWACFGLAVMWFQYNSLKQFYGMRKMMKEPEKPMEIEPVDKMLKEFEDTKKNLKGGDAKEDAKKMTKKNEQSHDNNR